MKEKNIYNPDTKIVNCPTCGSTCNQSTGGVTNYFSPLQKENIEVKETQEDIWRSALRIFTDAVTDKTTTEYASDRLQNEFNITRK